MKKRSPAIFTIFLVTVILALSFCLSGCSELSLPSDTANNTQFPENIESAEDRLSLLSELNKNKNTSASLSDISAFSESDYGAIGYDFAIRFTCDGKDASLLFAGSINKESKGAFSATESVMTIGGDSYTYAFFNSYLLVQDGDDIHILYKSDKCNFDAACALLLADKTSGQNKLEFSGSNASVTLSGIGTTSGKWHFDKNTITIADEKSQNFALSATVSASSTETGSNPLKNINDGNSGSRWSSEYRDNQSVTFDLGSVKSVSTIKIFWEVAAASDFEILTSTDGKKWTTVFEESDNVIADDWGTYNFNTVSARYIKLACGGRLTEYGVSIYEFEIYEQYSEPITLTYSYENGKIVLTDGKNKYEFSTSYSK